MTGALRFFYGTLMDRELLSRVFGRRVPARALRPARLDGWRRVAVRGCGYLVLVCCPRARVAGVVVDRLSAAERDRLSA
jgi:hypothetical protein